MHAAALGKYSSSMQQASLGGSHFVDRAASILDNESAFKMLSRWALTTISVLDACVLLCTAYMQGRLCTLMYVWRCSCEYTSLSLGAHKIVQSIGKSGHSAPAEMVRLVPMQGHKPRQQRCLVATLF